MSKKILALTFPRQDKNLGLEPSILTVVPRNEEVIYITDNNTETYDPEEIKYYLCSVYITGMEEFIRWSNNIDKRKIIVGGYEPTITPKDFINYSSKVIVGPCDSFYDTIAQPGKIVKGITNYKNIPRYDIYDVKLNQQIIPDKLPEDIVTSINTSQGCPFKCDFCCSPLMCDKLMSKPIKLVDEETKYLNKLSPKWIFIRDENFPLQKDWKEKLKLIFNNLNRRTKIYLFSSANFCTEENVKYMKENGVYMICLGLEDITENYSKNKHLDDACHLLHKYGIYVYLSFIVDPLKVSNEANSKTFYKKLKERLLELSPEMICGNFLMPFRGTKIWDKYKKYITKEDFKLYNSKSAFLEKNLEIRKRTEYNMFKFQWDYYNSDFYNNNVRKFATGDTLYLRFLELKRQFNYGDR